MTLIDENSSEKLVNDSKQSKVDLLSQVTSSGPLQWEMSTLDCLHSKIHLKKLQKLFSNSWDLPNHEMPSILGFVKATKVLRWHIIAVTSPFPEANKTWLSHLPGKCHHRRGIINLKNGSQSSPRSLQKHLKLAWPAKFMQIFSFQLPITLRNASIINVFF